MNWVWGRERDKKVSEEVWKGGMKVAGDGGWLSVIDRGWIRGIYES
jgi:hypothetical protein